MRYISMVNTYPCFLFELSNEMTNIVLLVGVSSAGKSTLLQYLELANRNIEIVASNSVFDQLRTLSENKNKSSKSLNGKVIGKIIEIVKDHISRGKTVIIDDNKIDTYHALQKDHIPVRAVLLYEPLNVLYRNSKTRAISRPLLSIIADYCDLYIANTDIDTPTTVVDTVSANDIREFLACEMTDPRLTREQQKIVKKIKLSSTQKVAIVPRHNIYETILFATEEITDLIKKLYGMTSN